MPPAAALSARQPALPTPPVPPLSAASEPSGSPGGDGYLYDPRSRRDPFLSIAKLYKVSQSRAELPPLQRVELSDIKLVGVVSDTSGYYGLVVTPDGKGYTVRAGTMMGTNNGKIKAVSEQKLIVAEPTMDYTGKMTTREIEILQRPKEGAE